MPPTLPLLTRRDRRKAETRETILEAALTLFRDKGYEATTVRDITGAADIGLGTFFSYFPTKEHLLASFYGELLRDLATKLDRPWPTFEAFLKALGRLLVQQVEHNQVIFQGIAAHLHASEALRKADETAGRAIHARIAQAVKLGKISGELRSACEPEPTADVILFILNGPLLTTLPEIDPKAFKRHLTPHLDHLLRLLRA